MSVQINDGWCGHNVCVEREILALGGNRGGWLHAVPSRQETNFKKREYNRQSAENVGRTGNILVFFGVSSRS
eukprot:scaffold2823_cov234-Alexandrium_tamarense.AAC.2